MRTNTGTLAEYIEMAMIDTLKVEKEVAMLARFG
jgi:hypothetical protein